MKMKNIKIENYSIDTGVGRVLTNGRPHPLSFLSKKERENLDTIGYTGCYGKFRTRVDYLNSLNKGTFDIVQTKYDSGDFSESFLIIRAYFEK